MRICFVTTSFPRTSSDGYANFILQQAKSILLADGEHSVVVVAPHAPGLALREFIDGVEVRRFRYFFPASVQCLAYQHEGLFATVKRSRLAMIQLPVFLLCMMIACSRYARGAHLIHAQWLPTCVAALPVTWLLRIPLFITARGADVNMVSSGLSSIILWCARHAKTVFVVSDEFKRVLGKACGNLKLETLYNGVRIPRKGDVEGTAARCVESQGHAALPVLLYVGGLIARKRVDTLIEAMALLKRNGVSGTPMLKVIGQGPEKSKLEAMIDNYDLGNSVHLLGALGNEHVFQEMLRSDILVLPSESEGRPNVVLEAFACSLAVVATDIPGTSELVQPGKTGELFESGNARQLADIISTLAADNVRRRRLALGGLESLSEKHLTWSAHGKRLLMFYSNSISA